MAREKFEQSLALVLKHEGGYVDHPADPGGATNMGITRATLAAWRGRPVTKAEVRALGRDEAAAIYRRKYWDSVRADELPAGIDLAVFDAAVNSGPGRAIRWLQAAVGAAEDGRLGSLTLAAARGAPPAEIIGRYQRRRLAFLERMPTWSSFGRGWARRLREIEAEALGFAAGGAPVPTGIAPRPQSTPVTTAKETADMHGTKSLLASKTLWANLIGLAAVALSAFGLDASSVDAPRLGDAAAQIVAAGSFIASTVFRVTATKKLSLPAGD